MRKVLTPVLLGLLITVIATAGGGCKSTAGDTQTTTTTSTVSASPGIVDIIVQEAERLIQITKDNPDFYIIDIRTPDEYATGHLKNSILIDYYAESFKTELDKLDRAKSYLIYCRTGHRSGLARDIMKDMGFQTVYNMTGGITEWQAVGYGVVK